MSKIQIGIESLIANPPSYLRDRRLGLLMNQASVDARMRYTSDLVKTLFSGGLRAIFSPQHGIFGEEQANMIESGHGFDHRLQVPVYSLYSETRRPLASMLEGIDWLLIDLQDVGTRVYTFFWTMLECMKACAEHGVSILVLDRPNPLGGKDVEGPMLDAAYTSFVGNYPIPLRHGLTIAEAARFFQTSLDIPVELEVVAMQGWNRSLYYSELDRRWVAPSPNMPRIETTLLYPGQVLLEGTNLSEGRGTTLPFEMVGAPFIDPYALCAELERYSHPGVLLRPIRFTPTFDKWKGQSCGGVAFHVIDEAKVRSVSLTLALLASCHRLYGEQFDWLPPPYEYEYLKKPIDILFGNAALRNRLALPQEIDASEVLHLQTFDEEGWRQAIDSSLLYR